MIRLTRHSHTYLGALKKEKKLDKNGHSALLISLLRVGVRPENLESQKTFFSELLINWAKSTRKRGPQKTLASVSFSESNFWYFEMIPF